MTLTFRRERPHPHPRVGGLVVVLLLCVCLLLGWRFVRGVHAGGSAPVRMEERLLVALPVDVNTAGIDEFDALPEVDRAEAEAIVADRQQRGPFYAVRDLDRVPGIGPTTRSALEAFVTVGEVGPRPRLDLNGASASELERLPGIGPTLAARVVADRTERGPFSSVDDLMRVDGIGPRTVEDVRPYAEVR